MQKRASRQPDPLLVPRIRVMMGPARAFGPGKAELLEHIEATSNLRHAAGRMSMSYMKAWLLVKEMNGCYRKPLVEMKRGGTAGGHTHLTETGKAVLSLYHKMNKDSLHAMETSWRQMLSLLKK